MDSDDFSWGKLIGYAILIVGIVVLLECTNPSEFDHRKKLTEYATEASIDMAMEGRHLTLPQVNALKNMEYHSVLGLFSYSTIKYKGKTSLATIGICKWVYPVIEIQ